MPGFILWCLSRESNSSLANLFWLSFFWSFHVWFCVDVDCVNRHESSTVQVIVTFPIKRMLFWIKKQNHYDFSNRVLFLIYLLGLMNQLLFRWLTLHILKICFVYKIENGNFYLTFYIGHEGIFSIKHIILIAYFE